KPSPNIALWHDPTLSVDYTPEPVAGSLTSGPNPVLAATTIRYSIPERGRVRISVLDLSGREVVRLQDGIIDRGEHQVYWSPSGEVPAGTYVVRMETPAGVLSEKIVIY